MTRSQKQAAIPLQERFLWDEDVASAMCMVSRPTFREWVKRGVVAPIVLPGGGNLRLFIADEVKEAFRKLPRAGGISGGIVPRPPSGSGS